MSLVHRPVFRRTGDVTLVRFHGKNVALTGEDIPAVEAVLGSSTSLSHPRKLVLDLANVGFLSNSALEALFGLHEGLRADGGGLAVRDRAGKVFEVFEVARLVRRRDVPPEVSVQARH